MEASTGPKARKHLFGYLDETGLLNTPVTDQLFCLGLLVIHNPRAIHRAIIDFRNKHRFYEEFKFTNIKHSNLPLYKGLIDLFFEHPNQRFLVSVYDKRKLVITDYNKTYNSYCGHLIAESLSLDNNSGVSEYITVLADDVSSPKTDKFEVDVRDRIKKKLRRNALFGMCRLESHAVAEIQLCDVMLGLVAYSYKLKLGLIASPKPAKVELVKHLQNKLAVASLSDKVDRKLKRSIRFKVLEHL